MRILEKLFCLHKWKTHSKIEKYDGVLHKKSEKETVTREYTAEVLICENCGKIKQIEY